MFNITAYISVEGDDDVSIEGTYDIEDSEEVLDFISKYIGRDAAAFAINMPSDILSEYGYMFRKYEENGTVSITIE